MSLPIHPAASVILLRHDLGNDPHVLMGQRGENAVFMPSKYVFPGGRVDQDDTLTGPLPLSPSDQALFPDEATARAITGCALRELREETGQYFAPQALEDAKPLRLVFRAITPPKRPRRFDAWFLMADAKDLASDTDDFSTAQDELSHLHWIALPQAQGLDLPFVTEVILAEVAHILRGGVQAGVPFFDNSQNQSSFRRLR